MPSPFTSRLLRLGQAWLEETPDAHAALTALAPDPLAGAVALRWAAALHWLALRGDEPWASLWPPALNASDAALTDAIDQAWCHQQTLLGDALSRPPQTNEVQRSLALLPGLMHVATQTGLPLRLFEIGASAGLNLWCDRYRYQTTSWVWGDEGAALRLTGDWRGPAPWSGAAPALHIHSRAGCDADPIDLAQPGQGLRLTSFVWPDQQDRLKRVHAAQQAAAAWFVAEGPTLRAQAAADFVSEQLATATPGLTTVLMHSVVWQYIAPVEQQAILAALNAAGTRATAAAPLAWLRYEPPRADLRMELRCRVWRGDPAADGEDCLLATGHPHAAWVEWDASQAAP